MRKYMFMPMICLMLMSSTCQKKDHHFHIILKNQSEYDIYLCMLFKYAGEDKCALDRGIILKKNSVEEWNPFRHSIENSMNGGRILELYFVNSNHYNEQGVFYDCDSIFIKNDVLKHYKLTLEDLQRMEWEITYPPSGQ